MTSWLDLGFRRSFRRQRRGPSLRSLPSASHAGRCPIRASSRGTASTRSPCWGAARCGMSRTFYRVFDAVLDDNEGDAVFLVNGGDGELIRYDIGSGRTSRIGRRGSGPGEFGRPVWLEPHGPDSLLAYDMSLGRFSVFSRSGDFGRIFMGIGGCVDPAGKAYLPRDGPDSERCGDREPRR